MELIYYLAPFLGGIAIATLPGVNNYIAQYTKSIHFAILINFSLGTIILGSFYFLFPTVSFTDLKGIPLWSFLGGTYGTVTVVVMTITPAKLGIGKTLSTFITARLASATLIDHFGWMGMPQTSVTWLKVIGIIFAILGTFFILRVKATEKQYSHGFIFYGFLCFLSGISSSLQSTTNASLLNQTDSFLFVTWLNFSENLFLFVLVCSIFSKKWIHLAHPKKAYFWGLSSVLCSLTVISMMAFASSRIGVASTVVLSIITQMITSLIIDHFGWLRVARHTFSLKSVIGLSLLLPGAYLTILN